MANEIISYNSLLQDIKGEVFKVEQNISRMVNRQKVVMSWNIGKSINEYLSGNESSGYGQKLFEQLANDVGLNVRTLYQMSSFNKKYPELPADDGVLNWSHYRGLISLNDDEKRKELEQKAIENSMGAVSLQKEISQEKLLTKPVEKVITKGQKLTVTRGNLFNYKIDEDEREGKKFVDCGFNIFTEIETDFLESDGILRSIKSGNSFGFEKSDVPSKKIHTYKAFIDKVVDGDTLNVTLDLGFKTRHKEILRLSKINAPEKGTKDGEKSSAFLKKTLEKLDFVVIKTNKTDIYGRYVADVFFLKGESNAQKVADEGIYLSQFLLDEGMVEAL